MIVADTNILVYLLVQGERSAGARALREADGDWKVPPLWRQEFANTLKKGFRHGILDDATAREIYADALELFKPGEVEGPDFEALELSLRLDMSAYDAAFLALAEKLGVPLVTEDKPLIGKSGGKAMDVATYLRKLGHPTAHPDN